MQIDDMTIGQAREIAAMFGAVSAVPVPTVKHGIQIVVLDRGFIYVGSVTTDEEWVHIENASNIRVWGTTTGLGELVSGPTKATKLDKTGNIKASRKALIALIAVEEGAWKSAL